MTESLNTTDVGAGSNGVDPRMNEDYLRVISNENGDIILVGVVHDHPSSIARVESVIESRKPATIGLEIPPIAMPVFQSAVAKDEPRDEFTAAIQAAPDARAVGIDFPSFRAFWLLLDKLVSNPGSVETRISILRKAVGLTKHAIHCRMSAVRKWFVRENSPVSPVEYECSLDDPPVDQASHEQKMVGQSMSFLQAIETPPAMEAFDEVREAHMARQIDRHGRYGPVVAVIGIGHLDGVHRRLESA